MKLKQVEVYIDGACEPSNPGGTASFGVYLTSVDDNAGSVQEKWGVIGSGAGMSNNVAEYCALIEAFALIKRHFHNLFDCDITIYGDSQLVINQMAGDWGMKHGLYVEYAVRAKQISTEFPFIKYVWIPREKNDFADKLSKRALAEVGIKPRQWL